MAVDQGFLTSHTDQLLSILSSFKEVLIAESTLLKTTQFEMLPALLEKKAALSNNLETTHLEFTKTFEADELTLDKFMKSEEYKELPSDLKNKLSNLILVINECHDINLTNGMTVAILSNYNQTSLNILTGQETIPPIYGSTGSTSTRKNKNSLGQA